MTPAGTLADVTPALAAALGVDGFADRLGTGLGPGEVRGVALLLVDGLGSELLAEHADRAPALAELAAGGRTLRAGFPATTAVSVASLGTGLPAGEHGIVGYSMGVPPLDEPGAPADVVLNTLRWCAHGSAEPVDLREQLPPERVQAAPTVLERAARAGVAVTTVAPEIQRRSGLTRAALRGGRFHGVAALGDLAAGVLDALGPGAERAFCYAYHGDLDLLGHVHGPGSRPWLQQLGVVDRLVAAIVEDLPADTALAVVADHGMVGTDAGWRIDLDSTPELVAGVRRLAGEARVRHVFVADGALDDVTAAWRGQLGDAAWVRTRDEAIDAGWFGAAVSDAARGRIGDVVAAARGNWTLVRSRIEPRETALVGHHGSLTDAEQHVPLLLARGA
ncbi:alkaline phosphatase family protein [Actinomycetospora cinnamomea]|uniref:Type I phosphodiesterase/nucleotide pyrophosphatase n=1 Tax=Actinomycetospora cinnamomea TaxID=663609 RepID=A0A2U1FG15_9PSEU|nr:nucleotide pyrophosphatase/phosphodiesterase family protein [Actinomycetospora cinnamomea]PVZ11102.1 type I phosphodiesterase/nucleotide pyrophosphatase [Actinomycetospora cinnamomea]